MAFLALQAYGAYLRIYCQRLGAEATEGRANGRAERFASHGRVVSKSPKNRSADPETVQMECQSSVMSPTKNREMIAPIAVVPAAHPTCWPENPNAVASHVPRVTYQAPHTKY